MGWVYWLHHSTGSLTLRESLYAYSIVETLHVVSLAGFLGLVFVMDLKLLGWAFVNFPEKQLGRAILPFVILGFIGTILTGFLLFIANPLRMHFSIWLRLKLFFILGAIVNACYYHLRSGKSAGARSIFFWIGVIIFGRLIAYTWFDCDSLRSPLLVWFSGCEAPTP